jgi:hypothetical protein
MKIKMRMLIMQEKKMNTKKAMAMKLKTEKTITVVWMKMIKIMTTMIDDIDEGRRRGASCATVL